MLQSSSASNSCPTASCNERKCEIMPMMRYSANDKVGRGSGNHKWCTTAYMYRYRVIQAISTGTTTSTVLGIFRFIITLLSHHHYSWKKVSKGSGWPNSHLMVYPLPTSPSEQSTGKRLISGLQNQSCRVANTCNHNCTLCNTDRYTTWTELWESEVERKWRTRNWMKTTWRKATRRTEIKMELLLKWLWIMWSKNQENGSPVQIYILQLNTLNEYTQCWSAQ